MRSNKETRNLAATLDERGWMRGGIISVKHLTMIFIPLSILGLFASYYALVSMTDNLLTRIIPGLLIVTVYAILFLEIAAAQKRESVNRIKRFNTYFDDAVVIIQNAFYETGIRWQRFSIEEYAEMTNNRTIIDVIPADSRFFSYRLFDGATWLLLNEMTKGPKKTTCVINPFDGENEEALDLFRDRLASME